MPRRVPSELLKSADFEIGAKVGLVAGDPRRPACWACIAPGVDFDQAVEAIQRGERVEELADMPPGAEGRCCGHGSCGECMIEPEGS